jgi:hypothetical protein
VTLPASPNNQWGGYYTNNTPVNTGYLGTLPNQPATGTITVPQDPIGYIPTFTVNTVVNGTANTPVTTDNSPATFNYNNTITSTREMIDITLNVYAPQQGTPWLTNATVVSNQPTNFSLRNCVNLGN